MNTFNKKFDRSKAKAKPQGLCGQVDCFVLSVGKFSPYYFYNILYSLNDYQSYVSSFFERSTVCIHKIARYLCVLTFTMAISQLVPCSAQADSFIKSKTADIISYCGGMFFEGTISKDMATVAVTVDNPIKIVLKGGFDFFSSPVRFFNSHYRDGANEGQKCCYNNNDNLVIHVNIVTLYFVLVSLMIPLLIVTGEKYSIEELFLLQVHAVCLCFLLYYYN